MKFFLIILIFSYSILAQAQTKNEAIYKCEEQGKIIFSGSACKNKSTLPVKLDSTKVNQQDYADAIQKTKRNEIESKKLAEQRHKRDEKYKKEMQSIAKKNEKDKEKCLSLRDKTKTAKENANTTTPKNQEKLKRNYQNALEKSDRYCKGKSI